jgi:Putative phage abortive infection protein
MRIIKAMLIGTAIGLALILSVLIGFYITLGLSDNKTTGLAEASYIGTVVAGVASVIGVVLLYKTYISQKQELQATQQALRLQKVDSAFFSMLSLLQEIVNGMSDTISLSKGGEEVIRARAYLKAALKELHNSLDHGTLNMRPNPLTGFFNPYSPPYVDNDVVVDEEFVNYDVSVGYGELIEEVAKKYEIFYIGHQKNLGHYFRYVYNILKYILDSDNALNPVDRKRYLGILQSQLSNDELGLIFYNVLSKHGRNSKGQFKFLKLLDEYKLLENMDRQSLKDEWHHWFFPKTMFKFLDSEERDRKIQYQREITKFKIPA